MRAFALSALALLGASPPAGDLTAAATCTLDQPATDAAFNALPLLSTEDDTEADERGTIYTFKSAGQSVWGAQASRIQLFAYSNRTTGNVTQRYQIKVPGDYEAFRTRLFAAHGSTRCNREVGNPGARSCEILPAGMAAAADGKWRAWTSLDEEEGELMLTCDYAKAG